MFQEPNLQNSNQIYNNPYTPEGYEKPKPRKLLLVVAGVVLAILVVIAVIALMPKHPQNKQTKSATTAARKQIPDAQVNNVKVAGGFAIALVSDPSAQGQANSGNETIFKVNKDGSMTQIANGSSFTTLDLLGFGIPLATQAQLTGSSVAQLQQNLIQLCGYDGATIAYIGFDASFDPGGWQIDSGTLSDLEQKLSAAITNQNANAQYGTNVFCVNATRENSNDVLDKTTYISTFTLQVQFITANGTLTTHTVTFAIGPGHYSKYTLDGQDIQ